MLNKHENLPIKNSIFENEILLQWFIETCSAKRGDPEEDWRFLIDAVVFGWGPYDNVGFLANHMSMDMIFSMHDPDIEEIGGVLEVEDHVAIVGREGWKVEELDMV